MFIALLGTSFGVALIVSFIVARLLRAPVDRIMSRLIAEEISSTWTRYIVFAIYVVGISGGVRIWELEKYITPRGKEGEIVQLTSDHWVLELYSTVIGTLQSVAWMLLLFFIFALIAFVIVRGMEMKRQAK